MQEVPEFRFPAVDEEGGRPRGRRVVLPGQLVAAPFGDEFLDPGHLMSRQVLVADPEKIPGEEISTGADKASLVFSLAQFADEQAGSGVLVRLDRDVRTLGQKNRMA